MKDLLELGVTCVMLLAFLSPMNRWMGEDYDEMMDKFVAMQEFQEEYLLKSAESLQETLIVEEYEAYIFTEARTQGIYLQDVQVLTQQDEGGCPVPCEISYIGVGEIPQNFKEQMAIEMGVPSERQITYEKTMEAVAE